MGNVVGLSVNNITMKAKRLAPLIFQSFFSNFLYVVLKYRLPPTHLL